MAFDSSFLGLPVELSQISSTLKALWDTPEQRTRACLLNLVVLCQGTQNLAANTELIAKFVRNHACRAILVGDAPAEKNPKASAWIQAHCHMTKAGAQEICSEQITMLAEGLSQTTVANMIMANLDYDLPLNLWWQGELPPNTDSPLWQRVDRLILDSLDWQDPTEDLKRASQIRERFGKRLALADLNWTRTLSFRQALAISFDSPLILNELNKIEHLEIQHAPNARLTALLLAGWFAAQLSWEVTGKTDGSVHFLSPSGGEINCTLIESPGDALSAVTVRSAKSSLSLRREPGSNLLEAREESSAGTSFVHFPAGCSELTGLLSEEMMPSTQHKIYLKTLGTLQALLS